MSAHPRPMQHPVLPWEITDAIIDHLHSDVRALAICSAVCAEWLIRSRHHIFSTVQLWPWRAQRFFELAASRECTFVNKIRCIEVDDSKTVRKVDGDERGVDERGDGMTFFEAMAHSHFSCFAQVRTLIVRNVDWTKHPLRHQATLRTHLSKFHQIDRLELHGVVFHDMREVVRVVDAFPALYHLTANVTFMKMLEHTIASEMTNHLTNKLGSLDLGTDDSIPALLSSVVSADRNPCSIRELNLQNIRSDHLKYVQNALERAGSNLRHLSLGFESELGSKSLQENTDQLLNFSRLSYLETLSLEGWNLFRTSSIQDRISVILERIESSFLESIRLRVRMDVEDSAMQMQKFNWCRIERALLALNFFGMKSVVVVVDIPSRGTIKETEVENWIMTGMNDLYSRGALRVRVVREGSTESIKTSNAVVSKET